MSTGRGHAPIDRLRHAQPHRPPIGSSHRPNSPFCTHHRLPRGLPQPPSVANLPWSAAHRRCYHPGAHHIIHIEWGPSQVVGSAAQFNALSRQWPAATADETLCNLHTGSGDTYGVPGTPSPGAPGLLLAQSLPPSMEPPPSDRAWPHAHRPTPGACPNPPLVPTQHRRKGPLWARHRVPRGSAPAGLPCQSAAAIDSHHPARRLQST